MYPDQAKIHIDIEDPHDILTIDEISLMNGDTVIKTYGYKSILFIYQLEELVLYTLKVDYHYDLGEGDVYTSAILDFQTPNVAVDYFTSIALGSEFGNGEYVTKRWEEPMKIYVDGTPSTELLNELDRIITEINDLVSNGFYIEIVDTYAESNFAVVFSDADFYVTKYGADSVLASENWGLFTYYDNNNIINGGHMYVDIFRANTEEQKHLLREELTQALGLAQDSYDYPDSIFYQQWSTVTEYAEIDRDIIWLLYHPNMSVGLTEAEARVILNEIIKNGLPDHES